SRDRPPVRLFDTGTTPTPSAPRSAMRSATRSVIQPTRRSARSPRPFAPLAAVLLTLALAACDSGETTVRRVYEVAPQKVVCQGVGMQLCLQVREPGEEAWTLMYTAPEGFVFQWGLAARIVVEERTTEPVALDAGSLRR